ncbi:MAG: ribonuclease III [Deltaproteobacteria bacterium]|nr:ribonuclease III [Deltaproteobacteria bacterium]
MDEENKVLTENICTENIKIDDFKSAVENNICYSFNNSDLMFEAFTHKSYFNEEHPHWNYNERLEFLGDAVLDLIISDRLMGMIEKWPEGKLTQFRSSLVNEQNLAKVAENLNIGPLILLGKGEIGNNGRVKPSILSDCVEAVIAAIYRDSDFETCRTTVLSWFEDMIQNVVASSDTDDYKGWLQKELQSKNQSPSYNLIGSSGPDHDKTYEVEIIVDSEVLATGSGKSKKEAEKTAARHGLKVISKNE